MATTVLSVSVPAKNDFQHPVEDQQPELEYCVNDSPPWVETSFLAFQHYLTMLGTTVVIPSIMVDAIGGDDRHRTLVIQALLFVSGLTTLGQTFFGTRLPAVIGGSYAFMIPTLTIINSPKLLSIYDSEERFLQTIRAIQGALICASSIQIALGFSGVWGVFSRFMCPMTIAPVIMMTALGIYEYGFPGVGKCVQIGLPQLALILILSQYLKSVKLRPQGIPVFERFPIIFSMALIWAYAQVLTLSGAYRHSSPLGQMHCRTDRANLISSAPWVRVPYPLQWGTPTFSASHVFGMMAAVLVSLVESTGTFYGLSRLSGATPPPSHVLSRGIGWQGIGIMLCGMFGTATGCTALVENAGLIGLTRVGSRRIVQLSAILMIFFSVFGKFGAILASIPVPLFAAVYCILAGVLASTGFTFLQFANLSSRRNLFILGFSLFLGLSVPQYFREFADSAGHGPVHSGANWFDDALNVTFSSNAAVTLMVAVLLDNTLDIGAPNAKNRGVNWWSKFYNFGDDVRSEEFYKLPLNLNDYFPQA
ncbi:hypothetical protein SELMODRAFT_133065 [Selaginella moellendorffii]|uniref:Uncharacterized protein n=1 Tax=Selaginella moellendorffii TaxID=88036 RepID=D8T6H2_SELML|nr:nucleobase-ascorbate transporter 2 isoform X2 [Selaginella moellendorffii]EFJ07724.1 hypothetical protein SELMODRAFT_133065 [Selaginella moellendorffii]|eukprot:XP_002991180.1 nucleobase-ascorbate transporter 2 isoform X2 [Selaginella moellendorffii]